MGNVKLYWGLLNINDIAVEFQCNTERYNERVCWNNVSRLCMLLSTLSQCAFKQIYFRFAEYPGILPYMSYLSGLGMCRPQGFGFFSVVVFQTGILFDQLWTTERDRKPRYYHSRWIWPILKLVFTPVDFGTWSDVDFSSWKVYGF